MREWRPLDRPVEHRRLDAAASAVASGGRTRLREGEVGSERESDQRSKLRLSATTVCLTYSVAPTEPAEYT